MTNVFRRVRPSLKQVWAGLLQASGCLWWAKRQLSRRGAVMVLTFHRVLNDAEYKHTCSLPGMVIRRRTFETLATYVAARYEAVDFGQAVEAPAENLRVMFTFDDGWRDNYTNAVPALRARGIPATVFICPGLLGRALPFWPELVSSLLKNAAPPVGGAEIESLIETLKTYNPEKRRQSIARLCERYAPANGSQAYNGDQTASWGDIREMDAAGISFGCHTHTHEILTTLPAQAARDEIRKAKSAIEKALYKRCNLFAYPNGSLSAATRRILAEEGFTAAFTTRKGAWTVADDPMAIPRVNVCEANVVGLAGRFSPAMFQYNVFWKAWRAMQAERRVTTEACPEAVLREA